MYDYEQHHNEVREATRYLKETIIRPFVQRLDTCEIVPLHGRDLINSMHAEGINVRYLGYMRGSASQVSFLFFFFFFFFSQNFKKYGLRVFSCSVSFYAHNFFFFHSVELERYSQQK